MNTNYIQVSMVIVISGKRYEGEETDMERAQIMHFDRMDYLLLKEYSRFFVADPGQSITSLLV